MIKIANVLEDGRFGGAQARVVSVAERLKRSSVETCVLYPVADSDELAARLAERKLCAVNVRLHRLTKQRSYLLKYVINIIPDILALVRHIKASKADIVHCNGSWQFKSVIAAKLAGKKVIWHLNDTQMEPLIKRIFLVTAKLCSDGIIVAGRRVYQYYLQGTGLEHLPVCEIHAPVETQQYHPEAVEPDAAMLAMSGIRILTVANVNPRKGLEDFIDVAAVLNAKYANLHFVIAGAIYASQSDYHRVLLERIASHRLTNVTFTGKLPDVRPCLKAADIFLFTSLNEASPTSVWEAMSMGKAIVSTDVGSVSQYIKDGENGFVLPAGDVASLARRVELLMHDSGLRSRMGKNARETAVLNLDVDLCAERHAEFYRRILRYA